MVDIFALAVSHGLLALAVLRLMWRDDLYDDGGTPPEKPRKGITWQAQLPPDPSMDVPLEAGPDA